MKLVALYRHLGNKSLRDCFEPPAYSIVDGRKLFKFTDTFASEVLKVIDTRRREQRWIDNHEVKTLADELSQFTPSLTWSEVLYHYISQLADNNDRASLRTLDECFSTERYCLKCDKLFCVSKYNPGHFICPRCSAWERTRRYRERKRVRFSGTN